MKSFKEFLMEIKSTPSLTKISSVEKAVKFAKAHCSKNEHLLKKDNNIWRGVSGSVKPDFYKTSTANLLRPSRHNSGWGNLLADTFALTNDFPKRQSSLICATSEELTKQYGDSTFVILPTNDSKIAICNSEDFVEVEAAIFGRNVSMDELDAVFDMLCSMIKHYGIIKASDASIKTLNELIIAAKERNEVKVLFRKKFPSITEKQLNDLGAAFSSEITANSLGIYQPSKILKKNKECWVEGEALMIPERHFEDFNDLYWKNYED